MTPLVAPQWFVGGDCGPCSGADFDQRAAGLISLRRSGSAHAARVVVIADVLEVETAGIEVHLPVKRRARAELVHA
jgi:hypothetical protein